jgi:hypothetical protein
LRRSAQETSIGPFQAKLLTQYDNQLSVKSDALNSQSIALEKEINEINRKMNIERDKRKDNQEREEAEARAKELSDAQNSLQVELDEFQKYDISRFEELKKKEVGLKNEINDHTDNIFTVKKWILKVNPVFKEDDINKHFEIPEDLDNV